MSPMLFFVKYSANTIKNLLINNRKVTPIPPTEDETEPGTNNLIKY
jgi:hypothetical protein